jgi:hypothetical protein
MAEENKEDWISLPIVNDCVCIKGQGDLKTDDWQPFEKYYEAHLYFDQSRIDFVKLICPKLRLLAQKQLDGQKNCFLLLGIQGIGKSQILTSLGHWVTAMGGSTTGFYFVSIGGRRQGDPLGRSLISMRYIVHDMAKRLDWNPPEICWESITDAWDWMLANGKVAFLVLDEFHKLYVEENSAGIFFELYTIGNNSGKRPIMVVLNGSSPWMRPLAFRLLGNEADISMMYPGYAKSESLNSTKFIPATLLPICSTSDMRIALSTIHNSAISDDENSEAYLQALCANTRGTIRHFKEISVYKDIHISFKTSCFAPDLSTLYKILWENVVQNVSSTFVAQCLSGKTPFSNIPEVPLRRFLDRGLGLRDLYNWADQGVIRFSGGDSVGFVHPADVLNCVVYFGRDAIGEHPSKLSAAEEVALLFPHASATCEVNENLVCESLCEKGLLVAPYGRLLFTPSKSHCFTGVVRTTAHDITPYRSEQSDLASSYGRGQVKKRLLLTTHNPAQLMKEWPNETGGDLIAVFTTKGFSRARAGVQYLVVRVQVKLGFSNTGIGDPTLKLKENEQIIAEALGVECTAVDFIRVVWSSRKVTTVEHGLTREGQNIVINSQNMLSYWSARCALFVNEKRLANYGYKEDV